MIYTLTLNPALDYVMDLPCLKTGEVNRSGGEKLFFGGKGINVSLVLSELGVKSTALGFIAGFTGDALEDALVKTGIRCDFCRLSEGNTRINVKLRGKTVTEINGTGPAVTSADMESLLEKLDALKHGDTLVLAGSIPPTLRSDTYEMILSRLDGRGVRYVVDASGRLLTETLKHRPYLIKPNFHELSEIAGAALLSEEDVIFHAEKLREAGAQNVLVSLGADGAILIDEEGTVRKRRAFRGVQVNSVGAGDSAVAGFLAGVENGYEGALLFACAAGGASAFSEGLAKREDILKLIEESK